MAHKHDGTRYFIIIDDQTGDCLYDSWADVLTFDSEEEAQEYIDDNLCEIDYQVETWLDY